jgi:hypothetical protein
MMAVLELYGKCKELGYCDCDGFFGCVDPRPPAPKPDKASDELRNAMKAEDQTSDYRNYAYRQELEAIEQSEGGLVECEVCDRSHLPSHPHITNIEGDTPLDDDEPVERKAGPIISVPPDDQLPEWLRDQPAAEETEDDRPKQICQVCGNPWAPRHACKVAVLPERDFNRPVKRGGIQLNAAKCDVCGKVKRSNHNCKGRHLVDSPGESAKPCEDCKRAGELCVRHGGLWSDYDTPKGQRDRQRTDDRIARTLPAPVSVTESETTERCRNGHPRTPENRYIRSDGRSECKECKRVYKKNWMPALPTEADQELAAIGTILRAVEGLESNQLKRVMSYVAARLEETE